MEENNDYNELLFISEKQPQSKKKRSEHIILTIICWLFQLYLFFVIGLIIYYLYLEHKWSKNYDPDNINFSSSFYNFFKVNLFVGMGVYALYIIIEFCSPTSKYLCRKNKGIREKMSEIFQTKPKFTLSCECYHYETYEYETTDSEGNTVTETRTVKVVSHRENYIIPYYCCRDVSGLFVLNTDKNKIRKKAFIKLELKDNINFAEAISYYDYICEKNNFISRNEHRDVYFKMKEKKIIENLKHHYLINLGDSSPCFVHFFWFLIFTILPLAEFYKIYFNSLCIYQNYTIRKLISSRYDLSTHENNAKYDKFNPQLNLITQQIIFEPNSYIFINPFFNPTKPSEEKLIESNRYEHLIPKYEINTDYDISRRGTIKDNPLFINFNDDQIDNDNNDLNENNDLKNILPNSKITPTSDVIVINKEIDNKYGLTPDLP